MGLRRNKEALKKPPEGAAENVVQLAGLQCAFRAQAGKSPLQGQNKPPAERVVLTTEVENENVGVLFDVESEGIKYVEAVLLL